MALTGKFLADFESFYAAVQKAEVQLKGLETGAGKVSTSLNRMVDNFSGRKLIQDATVMAEAIERIGGASKLTESEQAKVNRTITEAIAKYKALGQEAPKAMLDLEQATRKVATESKTAVSALESIKGVAGTIAGALGIGLSIGAVVNFTKSVFDSASQIHDLSEQLGISSEAVQGFKFAAEQSGSSLDAVGTAITKMNQHLASGDSSTVKALSDAGIEFNNIRNLKPEDAFLAITDAVQRMPDPMRQTQVAMALFGKGAAELLPGIKEGFRGAADAADKMSNDTVNDLEAAQDAWGKLSDKVTIVTGKMIADALRYLDVSKRMMDDAAKFGLIDVKAPEIKPPQGSFSAGVPDVQGLDDAIKLLGKDLDTEREAANKAAAAAKAHADAIRALADSYSGATAIKTAADAIAAVNLNMRAGISIAQMTRDEQDKLNKTVGDAIKAYERLGRTVPPQLQSIYAQTLDITKLGPKIEDIGTAFKGVGEQIKVIPPELGAMLTYMDGLPKDTFQKLGDSIKPVPPEVQKATDNIGELSKSLSQLSQVAGDTFNGMVRDISTLVSSLDTANKSLTSFKDGKAAFKDGDTLSGITGMASGIIGIASAAIAAGKAISNMFRDVDHEKVNDMRDSFLATFGPGGTGITSGFGKVAAQLHELGAEGDAIFQRLINAKKVDEFTAAMREAQDALKRLPSAVTPDAMAAASGYKTIEQLQQIADQARATYEYMRDSGKYTAAEISDAFHKSKDAQIAALGDVSRATSDALAKLDSEYKSLSDSVGQEAEEAVMGVVETQQRARMDEIEREKKALEEKSRQEQESARETGNKVEEEGKAAHDSLQEYYNAHPLVMPGYVSISGDPTGSGSRSGGIRQSGGDTITDQNGNTVTTGDGSGDGTRRFATGTPGLGFVDFGKESPAWLHGKEAVVPQSRVGDLAQQIAAALPSAGSTQTVIHQTFLDGRKVAESMAPYLPREVHRLGLVRV